MRRTDRNSSSSGWVSPKVRPRARYRCSTSHSSPGEAMICPGAAIRRRGPHFLLQFPLGGDEGLLAGLPLPGRDLQQRPGEGIAVLGHHGNAAVFVQGQDPYAAGVLHHLPQDVFPLAGPPCPPAAAGRGPCIPPGFPGIFPSDPLSELLSVFCYHTRILPENQEWVILQVG